METKPTPFEYHDGKLGVKMSFLISDKNAHEDSLKLIKYRTLKARIDSDTCIEKQLRPGSWSYDALLQFTTLCQQWRDLLTTTFGKPKEEIKKSWFSEHYIADKKAFDFYSAYRYGEDNRKLDPAFIERYTNNASVLNAVISIKANRKAYIKSLGCTNIDIWDSLSKDVNAFNVVDHALPTTSRGLRMSVNKYVAEGYAGVISGRLQNQNAAKVKESDQMALLDELIYKHNNFDNAQVASIYNTVAGAMNWKPITAQTVGNRKEEKNLAAYAGRNGKNALLDNIAMQNRRFKPTSPMLMWTMDGWDAELLYQKTEVNKKGHSVTSYHHRLTMVAVLDPYNKYPVGYAIGTHETPELIKDALRNAMQHVKELFGDLYRPYQLQTDNYGKGALKPTYEACSVHYTPARVKNAKTKVIEPWFGDFNTTYCQIFDNWSGYNVDSGSENQPNEEMLNKIRHSFPDEAGCRQQLVASVEADRQKKQAAFVDNWKNTKEKHRSIMTHEMYLQYLGKTTGYTNRLNPAGLLPTIEGFERCYDSFDINFRKLAHLDWCVKYDPADMSQVFVTNAESRNGKLVEIIGTYGFVLTEKYIQPMALADRVDGDAEQLNAVSDFNAALIQGIVDERAKNAIVLDELLKRPELDSTLAKLVLTNSLGQHKNQKSAAHLDKGRKLIAAVEVQEEKVQEKNWQQQQAEYWNQKINLNDYA